MSHFQPDIDFTKQKVLLSKQQSPKSIWLVLYLQICYKSVVVNILICSTIKLFRLFIAEQNEHIKGDEHIHSSTQLIIFKIYNLHNKKSKHPMIVSTTLLWNPRKLVISNGFTFSTKKSCLGLVSSGFLFIDSPCDIVHSLVENPAHHILTLFDGTLWQL